MHSVAWWPPQAGQEVPRLCARREVDLWCSILVRRVLRRGNIASIDALRGRILAFVADCNRTAHPFSWTYRGQPLRR